MSVKSNNRTMGLVSTLGPALVSYAATPNVSVTLRDERAIPQPDMTTVELAPLIVSSTWRPTAEQRRTAKHFGNTEDVYDLLGL